MNKYMPLSDDPRLDRVFDLVSMLDFGGTLVVEFQCFKGEKLKLCFDSYLVYRKMDEGDALIALENVADSNCPGRSIYLVQQSDFRNWFRDQSKGVQSSDRIAHYALHALNDVVDVLSIDPPDWVWS
jgi:hypothetical protein